MDVIKQVEQVMVIIGTHSGQQAQHSGTQYSSPPTRMRTDTAPFKL
jgi:hypothetical protein